MINAWCSWCLTIAPDIWLFFYHFGEKIKSQHWKSVQLKFRIHSFDCWGIGAHLTSGFIWSRCSVYGQVINENINWLLTRNMTKSVAIWLLKKMIFHFLERSPNKIGSTLSFNNLPTEAFLKVGRIIKRIVSDWYSLVPPNTYIYLYKRKEISASWSHDIIKEHKSKFFYWWRYLGILNARSFDCGEPHRVNPELLSRKRNL